MQTLQNLCINKIAKSLSMHDYCQLKAVISALSLPKIFTDLIFTRILIYQEDEYINYMQLIDVQLPKTLIDDL
jgi:hypothetical protein